MYKNLIIGPFIFEELDLFPKETLLAGEWCKIKKIHNQYDVYSYPLNKLKNWYSARKKSSIIYDISLKILTNFLNEIHQKKFESKYWEISTNLFLTFFCDIITEKLILFENISKINKDIIAITLNDDFDLNIKNTSEFISNARVNDFFNWQISSIVWKSLNLQYIEADKNLIKKYEHLSKIKIINKDIKRFQDKKNNVIKNLFLMLYNLLPEPDIIFYMALLNRKGLIFFFIMSRFKIGPFFFPKTINYLDKNFYLREKIFNFRSKSKVENIICLGLFKFLPTSIIEEYEEKVYTAKKRIKNKGYPKIIINGWGELISDLFSIWSAECFNKSAKIYRIQHGGGVGELVGNEEMIIKTSYKYLTWGWSSKGLKNAIPFFAARLFLNKKLFNFKRILVSSKILWIGTSDSRFCYQLAPRPIASQYIQYFNNQLKLAKSLDKKISNKVLFRPSFEDLGWDYKNNIEEISNYVRIDNFKHSLEELVEKNSLIIVDYMGSTPFPLILSRGIPCILVNLCSYTQITDQAKDIYLKLESVGIYYTSVEKLINNIDSIYENISDWWKIKYRQKYINEYLELFGATKHYRKSFKQLN